MAEQVKTTLEQPEEGAQRTTRTARQEQPQGRPCPKDCTKCTFQQHAFCAARMSFQSFEVMNSIIQRLDIQSQRITEMEGRMQELENHLASMQTSGEELSSPVPFQSDLFQE